MRAKTFFKKVVLRACSPSLQHRLRTVYLSRQVLKGQGRSEKELEVLASAVSPGDWVADLGANIGVYTRELSVLVGAKGRVFSCEPIRQNYEILRAVIRKGGLLNVRSFQVAVGSHPGKCEMVIPHSEDFSGYYWARLARPGDSGIHQTVEAVTLDELLAKSIKWPLDFIKCDVEGAELEVLLGGREVIRSQRPAWLLEVRRATSDEVFRFFHDLGYQSFVYSGKLAATATYCDKQFSNYFFFHPQSKVWNRVSAMLEKPLAARATSA